MDGHTPPTPKPTHGKKNGIVSPLFYMRDDTEQTRPFIHATYRNEEDAPEGFVKTGVSWHQSGSEEWNHRGVEGFEPIAWADCVVV